MGAYDSHKQQIIQAAAGLVHKGLLIGTGGNVSMRIEREDLVAITPSSKAYLDLAPEDICIVDADRNLIEGQFEPSVETNMHLSVYQERRDVNAIVHTHQVHASIFSLISRPIPALFDDQVANLGDKVEIVPYAVSGSKDLKANILAAVPNKCNAFILQNHGCLALGMDLARALRNADLLEKTARVYYHALTLGEPVTELPTEMCETIFGLLKSDQRKEIRRKKKLKKLEEKSKP